MEEIRLVVVGLVGVILEFARSFLGYSSFVFVFD